MNTLASRPDLHPPRLTSLHDFLDVLPRATAEVIRTSDDAQQQQHFYHVSYGTDCNVRD